MKESNRPVIIAGNWKMYKTVEEALAYAQELAPLVQQATALTYLAVPFTSIQPLVESLKKTNIVIGAQNMHDATEGAFTGEIAAKMLVEIGAKFVILGHSERRRLFNESNAFINRKVKRAVEEHLPPILCIGETLEQREQGLTEQTLTTQLAECLADLHPAQTTELILAYEPVWAIGTDQTATPAQAQEAHQICRNWLEKTFGSWLAQKTAILYGGSVKPENSRELLEQTDIDGLLVGGASLSADTFSKIVNNT